MNNNHIRGNWRLPGNSSNSKLSMVGHHRRLVYFLCPALLVLLLDNALGWETNCTTSGTTPHLKEIFLGRCNIYIVQYNVKNADTVSGHDGWEWWKWWLVGGGRWGVKRGRNWKLWVWSVWVDTVRV